MFFIFQETCYPMNSDPQGFCLILSMREFSNSEKNREGALANVESLEKVFESFNFKVWIRSNLTKEVGK